VLSLIVLFWGGAQIADVEFTQPKLAKLRVQRPSLTWLSARMVEVFRGVQSSVYIFFTPLATFVFFGQEESLGTLQSVAAVVGAVIIYFLARQLRPAKRLRTLQYSVLVLVMLSVLFVVQFSVLTALAYLLFMSTLYKIQWITSNPITMRVIDEEEDGDPTNNYAYVCDREIYLNVGRVLGVVMFLGVVMWQTQVVALRLLPIFAAVMQIGLAVYVGKIDKNVATDR
jgi:YQGE family putative transporter